MKAPARIEYWDDEIDSLHSFDLATQRREDTLEKLYLSPAREVLFGAPADAAALLRKALSHRRGKKKTAMAACMEQDLAMMDGGALPEAMDKYLGIRYPEPATLLDYFDEPILILEEPASLHEAERANQFRREEEAESLYEDGVLCDRAGCASMPTRPGSGPRRNTIPPSVPKTLPAACRTSG